MSAVIGYQSIITAANLSGTVGTLGHPVWALLSGATWETYQPTTVPATISVFDAEPQTADYLAVAGYGLYSAGVTVRVDSSPDTVTWTAQVTLTATNDSSALIGTFTPVTTRYWRIIVSGTSLPHICAIYLGQHLEMERGIYGGHSPILLSASTAMRANVSERGWWLGRTVERQGTRSNYRFQNLSPDWYRDNFDPFVKAAVTKPFFIQWRPQLPNETAYAWVTSDARTSNIGKRGLMAAEFEVESFNGYAGLAPSGQYEPFELEDGDALILENADNMLLEY